MKKIQGTITILILSATVIALTACANILDAPQSKRKAETGTVYIAVDGDSAGDRSAARTLAPDSVNFTRYRASFSGPESHDDVDVTVGSTPVDLAPGDWTVTVTAYTGTDTATGRGSAAVRVESGQPVTANITITPITGDGGTGNFRYSVSIPPVDSATLTLADADTGTVVSGAPIDLKAAADGSAGTADGSLPGLGAGYYLMNIRLGKSGIYAGRTEVVHIYHGLETAAVYNFTDDDFPLGISLADGVWQNGDMTVNGSIDYYRFPVTAGNTYVVSWNDSSEGDGTKDLNIKVSAYYEAGEVAIFSAIDSGYHTPQSFSAALNGNVILKVESYSGWDTGTYAVIYVYDDEFKAGQAAAFRSGHSVLDKTVETIAAADETMVNDALSAYGSQSDAVKVLLAEEKVRLDSLTAKIEELKAAAEAFKFDHSDILDKTLETVEIVHEAAVDAALGAHDDLDDAVKALLTEEKALLESLKAKIEELEAAAAEEFRSDHSDILDKTVETVAVADEAAVDAALGAYDSLDDAVKVLLTDAKDLLDSLEARIATLGEGSITLVYPTDMASGALSDTSITIAKTAETYQTTHNLTVIGDFDSYRWRVDGSVRGSDNTFTLDAGAYATGTHQISLEVTLNGVVYSKSGSFTVES